MVVKVDLSSDRKSVRIQREIEGGIKNVIEMPVPCLMAVNKGINSPRYASLPGIMKAKKKEIKRVTFADLGLANESPRVQDGSYRLPPERKAGKRLDGEPATQVRELVKLLREEAKVI